MLIPLLGQVFMGIPSRVPHGHTPWCSSAQTHTSWDGMPAVAITTTTTRFMDLAIRTCLVQALET